MIPARRFDTDLGGLLEELAATGPAQMYVEEVLAEARTIAQGRGWSVVARQLPLDPAIAFATIRPTRTVLVLILLLLALITGIVATGGLRLESPPPLPPPFGPAANGLVTYARDGDLWARDTSTGAEGLLIGGPESDGQPGWTLDGTRITFIRQIDGQPWLMVAAASGGGVHPILDRPALGVLSGSASPDGRSVAIISDVNGRPRLSIHPLDGTAITTLDLGIDTTWPVYRPPDGRQIVVRGIKDGAADLYLVDPDGRNLQPLHLANRQLAGLDLDLLAPAWSPNGRLLAYHTVDPRPDGPQTAVHILDVSSGADRVLPVPGSGVHQGWALWSPDGTRIAVQRWTPGGTGRFAIVPADGRDAGIEVDLGAPMTRGAWIGTWSPDGTQLLEWLDPAMGLIDVDPVTGVWHRLAWLLDEPPDWQRVAP